MFDFALGQQALLYDESAPLPLLCALTNSHEAA